MQHKKQEFTRFVIMYAFLYSNRPQIPILTKQHLGYKTQSIHYWLSPYFSDLFFFCLDKFQKTLVKVLRQQVRQLVRRYGLDVVQHIRQPLLRVQVIHRTRLKETVHH